MVSCLSKPRPNWASFERREELAGLGHLAADDLQRGVPGIERLDLVLVEPADLDAPVAVHVPRERRQRAGDQLGEGRLARAVDAQQADAVVGVEAQVEPAQHRRAVVADRDALEPQQRRRQRPWRRGQGEGRDPVLHHRRDRLELGQPLQPALGLGGLGRLGAEAVDEGLQVRPLGLLLGAHGRLQPQLLGAALLEVVVAAGVEVELAAGQMQGGVHLVEQLAVVADHQGGVRILLQPRLEPERAFQVEVIGGLVEQQQVGLGEQRRGQGHAHAPAAGELGHGAGEVFVGEAQAAQDLGGARRRPVRADLGQAGVELAQPLGRRGVELAGQPVALDVGGEHGVEQGRGRRRVLLVDR